MRSKKSPTPIARTAVKKVNAKRSKRDFVKHFHSAERVGFINSLPCVVEIGDGCTKIQNHHVTSRGAGGNYLDIVPICEMHHAQLHSAGREWFEGRYHVGLDAAAFATEKKWQLYLGSR